MSNKRTGRMPASHPEKVNERCNGMCEGCRVRRAENLHHRRFLSRGGKHNLANLIALCGSGNHSGCHGIAHSGTAPEGWAISMHDPNPETNIPFTDLTGRRWQLDDHGNITDAT